ncbi:sulfur carrier protein ThiS adenylyltransferase ThiF [uncultured Ruminococcus sp.]|uniref:sulfur carrier protein ThiS adenylyltransferase ThiF n=1 Tax=uncultured Ruminococcus sp. TaxID=165186 RepID=UPI0025F19A49|nr:sulfur carrier protein ThiS adenylyltransferase ThiF [uncultured Ruminococcus sp.]
MNTKIPDKCEIDNVLSMRHTQEVLEKLKNTRVAVAGLGGLGSNIALMLARAGVGTLHLIDFDEVDLSNLNRQQYFICHLGLYKTDAIKDEISRINPYINVITDCVKVTDDNIDSLFKDDNVICEAFDNPDCKAMLVNRILETRKDAYIVAASGMAGTEKSNTIITRKITDRFYLCGDETSGAVKGNGLMSPRVTICAAHQANAILRIVLGKYDV